MLHVLKTGPKYDIIIIHIFQLFYNTACWQTLKKHNSEVYRLQGSQLYRKSYTI